MLTLPALFPRRSSHIIVRGIERRKIFLDEIDRTNFIERLEKILTETETRCYAWALMSNHFHLLLRTGVHPIATVMRRLLTGHAMHFNRYHRRSGRLFQNRYKSILCQEDAYLMELVRYIHLNPLRAHLVADLKMLDKYAYSGHSILMSKREMDWFDKAYVLKFFGAKASAARRNYRRFVEQGVDEGRRPELIGGGLLRSAGGGRRSMNSVEQIYT